MAKYTVSAELEDTYGIELSIKKSRSAIPPFRQIGRSGFMNHLEGIDFLDILLELSKPTQAVFKILKELIDIKTNEASYSPSDKSRFSRAYKEMKAKGIIKRLKPKRYIFNPKMLIPSHNNYSEVQKQWDALP